MCYKIGVFFWYIILLECPKNSFYFICISNGIRFWHTYGFMTFTVPK